MGEFQELKPIEGLEVSSVSADLYEDGRDDLSLFFFRDGANFAAIYTTSKVTSASINWNLKVKRHFVKALLVNTQNANTFTGIKGAQGARGKMGIRGHTGVPGPATDNDPWSDYKVKSQLRKVHDKIIRKIKTRKAQLTVKPTDIYLQLPRKNKAKLKKTFFVDGGNKYWVQAKKRKFILSSNTDEKIIPS